MVEATVPLVPGENVWLFAVKPETNAIKIAFEGRTREAEVAATINRYAGTKLLAVTRSASRPPTAPGLIAARNLSPDESAWATEWMVARFHYAGSQSVFVKWPWVQNIGIASNLPALPVPTTGVLVQASATPKTGGGTGGGGTGGGGTGGGGTGGGGTGGGAGGPLQSAINALQAAILSARPDVIAIAVARVKALPVSCQEQIGARAKLLAALERYAIDPSQDRANQLTPLLTEYAAACPVRPPSPPSPLQAATAAIQAAALTADPSVIALAIARARELPAACSEQAVARDALVLALERYAESPQPSTTGGFSTLVAAYQAACGARPPAPAASSSGLGWGLLALGGVVVAGWLWLGSAKSKAPG